ncbi:MAG: hypothetical protein V3T30_04030, partial [Thermodesulfobacteriota bacterium]
HPGEEAAIPAFESEGSLISDGPISCLVEGPLERVAELARSLEGSGIPFEVARVECDEETGPSCGPSDKYGLVVPEELKTEAIAAIEDYWQNEHPELKEVNERMERGECPACGFNLMSSSVECPECGLNLAGPGPADDSGCC